MAVFRSFLTGFALVSALGLVACGSGTGIDRRDSVGKDTGPIDFCPVGDAQDGNLRGKPDKFGEFRVHGYLPSWKTNIDLIPFQMLSHVAYFGLMPGSKGTVEPGAGFNCSEFQKMVRLAHEHGTKAVILVGGASTSKSFLPVAANPEARIAFANNLRDFALKHGVDGIDIDWEGSGEQPATAYKNIGAFFQALGPVLHAAGLTLSADLPGSNWAGSSFEAPVFEQCDYVNVMAYDYSGSWMRSAIAHSDFETSLTDGIKYYETRAGNSRKVVWGVPYFGIGFGGTTTPGSNWNGTKDSNGGRWDYSLLASAPQQGYTLTEGDEKTGSYLVGKNEIIFFDSSNWIRRKTQTGIDRKLGGMMIWELTADTPFSEPDSLNRAIWETMVQNSLAHE